jgi:hypothetical protein
MVEQMNRDEHVKQLVGLLDDVFNFLTEASQLKEIETIGSSANTVSQIKILQLLFQQTRECANFICAYAEEPSYCKIFI